MKITEGSRAIAEVVRECRPHVIPVYPITPSTHIPESLAEMVDFGELDAEYIRVESEFAAMSACIGASAAGARVFTATASQGLLLMAELLPVASAMRLPILMVVGNRAISAPINIWNDHSDAMFVRDSGWMQLFAENVQEAVDMVVQGYRIAERVRLPVMVNIDGFYLTHVYEPVDIPKCGDYVGVYEPKYVLDPEEPLTFGPLSTPDSYHLFKKEVERAMTRAKKAVKDEAHFFAQEFGRYHGDLLQTYGEGECAIIGMGSFVGNMRVAAEGTNFQVVKIRSFRPFPREELRKLLKDKKYVVTFDRHGPPGTSPVLYGEVKEALYGLDVQVAGYVGGLGGMDVPVRKFREIMNERIEGVKWL